MGLGACMNTWIRAPKTRAYNNSQVYASGDSRKAKTDPSGNKILLDVGAWLVDQIKVRAQEGRPGTLPWAPRSIEAGAT